MQYNAIMTIVFWEFFPVFFLIFFFLEFNMTLFIPANHYSLYDLFNTHYFDARSAETINGVDIFGYHNGTPYSCVYEWYEGVEWVSAGEPIL